MSRPQGIATQTYACRQQRSALMVKLLKQPPLKCKSQRRGNANTRHPRHCACAAKQQVSLHRHEVSLKRRISQQPRRHGHMFRSRTLCKRLRTLADACGCLRTQRRVSRTHTAPHTPILNENPSATFGEKQETGCSQQTNNGVPTSVRLTPIELHCTRRAVDLRSGRLSSRLAPGQTAKRQRQTWFENRKQKSDAKQNGKKSDQPQVAGRPS